MRRWIHGCLSTPEQPLWRSPTLAQMTLPSDLLHAIAHEGGGKVVLVLGAGASFEAPTGLPLSRECSVEANRRLVADGVIAADVCTDPEDLSSLADAVFAATGSQAALVERLPIAAFRSAEPNEGYLIAACLLREQAVTCVMTLNFDLGMSAALTQLGATDVSVVCGPDEHHRLSTINVIYLHRNVNVAADEWILRTDALESEWRDQWEQVVVQRVVGSPVTVFAGLGSPAAVLTETVIRVPNALPEATAVYLVDPGAREQSAFFEKLCLEEVAYLRVGWCDFARALAARVLEEHRAELEQACRDLMTSESWLDDDPAELCRRVAGLGLVGLGELRARWTLDPAPYTPRRSITTGWLADLLLAIGVLESAADARAVFDRDGVVELRRDDRHLASVIVASGRGTKRWLALEAEIGQHAHRVRPREQPSRFALVSGVVGERPAAVAPPANIATGDDETTIIGATVAPELVSVEELRATPGIALRMAA